MNEGKVSYNRDWQVNGEKASINITLQGIENEKSIFLIEISSEKDLNEEKLNSIANELVDDLLNKGGFFLYRC